MEKKTSSEAGHANIALSALAAAVCIILLMLGANFAIGALVWIGGIGAAVAMLAQFWFTHESITSVEGRLDELEK